MPNYITHLAIAKVYAGKHKITDYVEFLRGSIAPDFRSQGIRHYLNHAADPHDVRKTVTDRVNLSKYLSKIDITKDFGRGVFLHMLADNYCYLNVLDIKKLQKAVNHGANYDASIYNSAMKHFAYIAKKYKIKAEDFESTGLAREMEEDEAKWAQEVNQKKLVAVDDIMDVAKLDKFIEEITRQPIEMAVAELRSATQNFESKPESKSEPGLVFVSEQVPVSVPEPKPEPKPEPQNTKESHQAITIDESFEHHEVSLLREPESWNTDIQSFKTSVMEYTSLKLEDLEVQKIGKKPKDEKKEKPVKDKEGKKAKKIEAKNEKTSKKTKESDENQSIAEDLVKTLQNSSMFRKQGG